MHTRAKTPLLAETALRRRKAHTKSRKGCVNCKMRHTKVCMPFNLLLFIGCRDSVAEIRLPTFDLEGEERL